LDTKKFIFLPGSVYQVNKFLEDTIIEEKDILIIGANSEAIAEELLDSKARSVIIIVDDNDTLIRSRFILSGKRRISTRMMEYTNTDFSDAAFDIVYAQASISTPARKKILKEIKRILRPDGLLCSGEIVNLEKEVPKFINDLRENSGIEALWINELNDFYIKAGFEIVSEENLSNRLQNFYRDSSRLLEENKDDLTEDEAVKVINEIAPPHKAVLITYLDKAEEIIRFCDKLHVHIVQLHGRIPTGELKMIKRNRPDIEIIKSLVVYKDNYEELENTVKKLSQWVDFFITDTFDPSTGASGATGKTHDWKISRKLVEISSKPVILAGGLNPSNVKQAILQIKPAGIDVHTGVESSNGRKDYNLVKNFILQAKQAFAEINSVLPIFHN